MADCYSRDEETFYPDLSDVLDMLEGDGELTPGVTIYEADTVQRAASNYAPSIDWLMENMAEQASDEAGEFAPEDWPGVETEKWSELEKLIHDWLDANVKVPFWTVRNVRKVTLTEADIADYRGEPTASAIDGVTGMDIKACDQAEQLPASPPPPKGEQQ